MLAYALSKKRALERIFVFQAVEYGYLTQEQLRECIAEHEQCDPPIPLLTICKQKGYLTPSQVNHLMSRRLDASAAKAFGEELSQREEKEDGKKGSAVAASIESIPEQTTQMTLIAREDKEEYERRLQEKERLLEREQKQRDFLRKKVEELEEKLRSFESHKKNAISSIDNELNSYKEINNQKEELIQSLQEQLEQKDVFVKRVQQKSKGLFNLVEQQSSELQKLEEQKLKLEAQTEKLTKAEEFLNNKLEKETSEKSRLKQDIDKLQDTLNTITDELEELRSAKKNLEREAKPIALPAELTVLEQEKKQLEQKTREQTRIIAKLQAQDLIQTNFEQQVEEMKKSFEQQKKEMIQEKKQLLDQFEQEKKQHEKTLHEIKISLESELSQYKQKSENLELKLQQYQSSLTNWDAQEQEKENIRKQIEEHVQKKKEIEKEKVSLEIRVKDLERKISAFQQVSTNVELESGVMLPGSEGEYYVIQKILGRGGMGIAYSALRGSDEKIVVVKTLLPEAMCDMKVVMRFIQEARTILEFDHENLVHGYDFQQGKSLSYFVMEYLDGESAETILDEQAFIEPVKATEIILGIAKALKYLEAHHLVHRDVKPANIIITKDGIPKLMDFGIVKMTDRTCSLTTEGIILGTPYYLSPEQTYETNVDIRSDIYSLGATYYHMVVGEVPFPGDNPIDVIQKRLKISPKPDKVKSDLPKPICNIIEKMMNRNSKKRQESAKELVTELENVLQVIKR
ncbi:MAG: protein kinase [Candidatus Brocadiae bacterium]|nr:protein kinase [Candidatus Brocadiia bacterium]